MGLGLACCKVGLDRPLIRTAFVANLFRSARVSRLISVMSPFPSTNSRRRGRRIHATGESPPSNVEIIKRTLPAGSFPGTVELSSEDTPPGAPVMGIELVVRRFETRPRKRMGRARGKPLAGSQSIGPWSRNGVGIS